MSGNKNNIIYELIIMHQNRNTKATEIKKWGQIGVNEDTIRNNIKFEPNI